MGEILDQKDQRGVKAALLRDLDLEQVRLRTCGQPSHSKFPVAANRACTHAIFRLR